MKEKSHYHNISSTTLFNFTDTFDRLVGNIRDGIYCGDIYEQLPQFGSPSGYIVPMVCFCDIPLGLIKEHLDWYGNYAIGIERAYARTLNICPVWYIHKDNPVVLKMFKSIENKRELIGSPILPYLKRFLGKQKPLLDDVARLKKFYDEREWRYIPKEKGFEALFMMVDHIEAEIYAKDITRKRSTHMPLELGKIDYIIVKNDLEKRNLYPILRQLSDERGIKYEDLISSIITCTQIRRDF